MARTKKQAASACGISATAEHRDAPIGSGLSPATERVPAGEQNYKERQDPDLTPGSRQNMDPYPEGASGRRHDRSTSPENKYERHDRPISGPASDPECMRTSWPEPEEREKRKEREKREKIPEGEKSNELLSENNRLHVHEYPYNQKQTHQPCSSPLEQLPGQEQDPHKYTSCAIEHLQEESAHGKGHAHPPGEGHGHGHGHVHVHSLTSLNRAFILGITLNTLFVAAEFTAGFFSNSMGLISDAGHNLSDVASLILAMIAFKLAKVPVSNKYTYGYRRSTILVSLLNAIILLIAVGVILAESIDKLFHPRPVEGGVIIWVAGIGVIINAVTAWLFLKDKEKDLNVKGAYLHMAADALVSVGVVISGIIIMGTGWYIVDPIIGILIALIIVYSTWGLLRDSLVLSLDGVPANIRTEEIEKAILEVPRVRSLHHLHIWAISTTETALTAHIVVSRTEDMENAKCTIKELLAERGIGHATLEMEGPGSRCADR